jgi:hypothetical protein
MKNIFFGVLIFLFLFSTANAIVIDDIRNSIDSGNEILIRNNSDLIAQVSSLKQTIIDLQNDITEMRSEQVSKNDLPQIYSNMNIINQQWNINQLVSIIAVVIGGFAFAFISKAKGWL